MRSLRSRLVVGFALVALVPLAAAMLLLSRHVRDTVNAQARDRLGATLGMLRRQLDAEGGRTGEKLAILGRDADLKRLYLVHGSGRALDEFLEEQRFLLGLDFLVVADDQGRTVAEAATPPAGASAAVSRTPAAGHRTGPPAIESIGGTLALAGGAPIPYQGRVAGVVRGGLWLDAAYLARLKEASGVDLAIREGDGAWDVATFAGGVPAHPGARVRIGGAPHLVLTMPLADGDPPVTIAGFASTAAADATVASLRTTALVLGGAGLALAILLGLLWSAQVSRPVERLAAFSERIAAGRWDEPLALRGVREMETLAAALDRMRGDLVAYRTRLTASERHAAWSTIARQLAHEIKNPLTPIAVSVADLKRSYERDREAFPEILARAARTIEDEVHALTRLLDAFSAFGALPPPAFAPCRTGELLDDLAALYAGEVSTGRLALERPRTDVAFDADRAQVRQALVNLVKNGLEAGGDGGHVRVSAAATGGAVEWTVADDGPGLDAEARARLFVPYFTTKARGAGIGLVVVERIVNDHGGMIAVDSAPGRGTTFRIRLPLKREAA